MKSHIIKIVRYHKAGMDKFFLLFVILLVVYGVFIFWSASGQDIKIMQRKILQIIIGLLVMILFSQISPRSYERCAPYLYILCIFLLVLVTFFGQVSNGAQRWLSIGIMRFQPSEIAKISVPLMISRLMNQHSFPPSIKNTIIALIFILIPTFLVAAQPDLGTAILIAASGLFVLFLAGIRWKFIIIALFTIVSLIPIVWTFCMHDYQRDRVMMFLNPEGDSLGAGYHIIQSKIAIGSGGLTGKGWLHGTQSQLEFVPERHTDFIFAVLGEELGLVGIMLLFLFYFVIISRGLIIAAHTQNTFCKMMAGSVMLILFFYVFVNTSMVSGLLPVVGIPLPLVSYGGSASIIVMMGFGIVMSIHTHKYYY